MLDVQTEIKLVNLFSARHACKVGLAEFRGSLGFDFEGSSQLRRNHLYVIFDKHLYKFDILTGSPILVARVWNRLSKLTLRQFGVSLAADKLRIERSRPVEKEIQSQCAFFQKCLKLPAPKPPKLRMRLIDVNNFGLCSSMHHFEPESGTLFVLFKVGAAKKARHSVLEYSVEYGEYTLCSTIVMDPIPGHRKFERVLRYALVAFSFQSRQASCQLITSPFHFYWFKVSGDEVYFQIQSFSNASSTLESAARSTFRMHKSTGSTGRGDKIYSGMASLRKDMRALSDKCHLRFPDPSGRLCKLPSGASNRQSTRYSCFRSDWARCAATGATTTS